MKTDPKKRSTGSNSHHDKLTAEQFHITQEKGTEVPFSGKYCSHQEPGTYHCICCGTRLFSSTTKYDSKSGWPSFYDAVSSDHVLVTPDNSHGMKRNEASCSKCGSHLGHIFEDGPKPTGLRYCINSASLDFKPHGSKE